MGDDEVLLISDDFDEVEARAKDSKKPYGDVTYADPGKQSDDKKRYPLDTEAHVRAAWSYINMPKNAAKYTSEQLASIKSKIRAAAKRLGIEISDDSKSEHRDNALTSLFGIETRSAAIVDGVNFPQRIITVLAVPYEQPTPVPFQHEVWNEVFSRSAFDGLDATKRRIPATACLDVPDKGHSSGRLVGRAISFDPTDQAGLRTDLKISRTPQGDETLELASENNLDVSVGFLVKNRLDQQLDRMTRTRRINRAFLDHIAFVADQPAYPGASVLAVRSENSEDPGLSPTPLLDSFIDDPIFQWARDRMLH